MNALPVQFFQLAAVSFILATALPASDPSSNNSDRRYQQSGSACNYFSSDGNYNLMWTFDGTKVNFNLDTQIQSANFWSGVGFGEGMSKGDYLLVRVVNNNVEGFGDYGTTGYMPPTMDSASGGQSNIKMTSGSISNGRLLASFSRDLVTGDSTDNPLNGQCVKFMYPIKGGNFTNNQIMKHSETPKVSDDVICPEQCPSLTPVAPVVDPNSPMPINPPVNPPPPPQPIQQVLPQPVNPSPVVSQSTASQPNMPQPGAGTACLGPDLPICNDAITGNQGFLLKMQNWGNQVRQLGRPVTQSAMSQMICNAIRTSNYYQYCCNVYTQQNCMNNNNVG